MKSYQNRTAEAKADRAAVEIRRNPYLHPHSHGELQRNDAIDRVREWLQNRFRDLGVKFEDELVWKTNRYNETNGQGLQSVSVDLIGERGLFGTFRPAKPVRRKRELQAPIIGIVTPGLLRNGARNGITRFPVEQGAAASLTALTDGLYMGGVAQTEPIAASHRALRVLHSGESVLVTGPNAVETVCELQNFTPDQVIDIVNRGVYACEYLKAG